jgi:hypothetical protein
VKVNGYLFDVFRDAAQRRNPNRFTNVQRFALKQILGRKIATHHAKIKESRDSNVELDTQSLNYYTGYRDAIVSVKLHLEGSEK